MNSLDDALRRLDPVDPQSPSPDGEPLLRDILSRAAPPARPFRRPVRGRLALAGAAVVAAAAGLVLAMPARDDRDVVAAAYEAISQADTILHYRVRHTNEDPGGSGRQTLMTVEVWQAGDGSRVRSIQRPEPRPGDPSATWMWSETVHTGEEWRTYVAPGDTIVVYDSEVEPLPGPGAAWSGSGDLGDPRTLLERARSGDEKVTELGEATVRGIPVLQFRVGECRMTVREAGGGIGLTWSLPVVASVTRDEYLPVRIEQDNDCGDAPRPEGGPPWDQLSRAVADYVDFETLPANEANRALLEMAPHPGAEVVDGEAIDAAEERDENRQNEHGRERRAPTPTPTP